LKAESKEDKTAIYNEAKSHCEDADDKAMFDFIKSAIQPKKE